MDRAQVLPDRRGQVRRGLAGLPGRPAAVSRAVRRQSGPVDRDRAAPLLRLRVAGSPRRAQAPAGGLRRPSPARETAFVRIEPRSVAGEAGRTDRYPLHHRGATRRIRTVWWIEQRLI